MQLWGRPNTSQLAGVEPIIVVVQIPRVISLDGTSGRLLQRKCCYVLARVEPNIVVVQLPRDLSTTLSGTNYRCPSINLQAGVGTIVQLSCRPNTSRLAGQL